MSMAPVWTSLNDEETNKGNNHPHKTSHLWDCQRKKKHASCNNKYSTAVTLLWPIHQRLGNSHRFQSRTEENKSTHYHTRDQRYPSLST